MIFSEKQLHTPHQVRGRLFRDHALSVRMTNEKGWSTVQYSRIRPRRGLPRFTHLAASVSEEDGGFTVQIRLSHETKPGNRAWGEERADSFEAASAMLGDLAANFSIPQTHIEISLRLENARDGTRH
jgi:hypothetical protein